LGISNQNAIKERGSEKIKRNPRKGNKNKSCKLIKKVVMFRGPLGEEERPLEGGKGGGADKSPS
jgi:hypothetical protein